MKNASVTPDTVSDDELGRLRGLVPLHSLPDEAFDELAASATFATLRPGDMLFEQGDTDHEHVYLLEGRVSLLVDLNEQDRVEAGSGTARFPLAHQLPRKQSVRALSQVRVARIDSRLLSDLLARAQTVDYQVTDLDDASEDDWMSQLLQSRVLQQVPAANIQRVMMSVEQVDVYRGDHLITQGDPGDYYYMLTRGRAVVRRDNGDGKGPVELATLGPGDAFGEEALLSDNPRNSSVTMLQDGHVLRLSKQNFLDLIQNPLLETVSMESARARVEQGSVWLDLRSREQYDESHLPGAINFPFESLRYQTSSLDRDGHYVLYSNSGRRAMAGAFLLTERGFDVAVLENGIDAYAPADDVDDDGMQSADAFGEDVAVREQIAEAEQRARELEQKLKEAEALKREQDSERQQQMQQVSVAVDMARRKLLESEAQKQEALSAKQEAYAEMERLTGSLEEVQSERTSLRERMAEIEGLDKKLQARLEKAEREIIGERDRAESAAASLEDLSQRLSDVLEQRELEREQHARERGELIEDVTGLQMDLEQAQLDLEELKGHFDDDRATWAASEEERKATAQRLLEMETANRTLQAERDGLLAEQEHAQLAQRAEMAKAEETRQLLAAELEQAQAGAEELAQRIAQAESALQERDGELAQLREQVAALEQARLQTQDATEAELAAVRSAGEQSLAEARQALDGAVAERERLLGEQATLQARLDDERMAAASSNEQQAARISDLERQLEQLRAEAGHAAADQQQANDEMRSTLEVEQQQHARDAAELAALQQAHAALQQDRDELQAQLASGDANAHAAVEQGQQRVAELEQVLAELRETSQAAASTSQQAIQQLQAELDQAAARAESAEQQLQQVTEQAGRQQSEQERAWESQVEELKALQQAAEQRVGELEQALMEQQDAMRSSEAAHDQAAQQLQAEFDQAVARVDAAEQQLQQATEQAGQHQSEQEQAWQARVDEAQASRQVAEQRVVELEQALDEMRAAASVDAGERDRLVAENRQALEEAEQRIVDLERRIDDDREASTTRLAETEQALQDAQRELADAQAAVAAGSDDLQLELEMLRSANEHLESQLAESTAQAVDDAELQRTRDSVTDLQQQMEALALEHDAAVDALKSELASLRDENSALLNDKAQREKDAAERDGDEARQQVLQHRLEERELALSAAREEQAELIRALNAAGSELEALQLQVSSHDSDQARLVDLENQLAELHRVHEKATLAHEHERQRLRDRLDAAGQQIESLQRTREGAVAAEPAETDSISQNEELLAELAARESEVEQLRGVIEEYVSQFEQAKREHDGAAEIDALRAELTMVREQAVRDVAEMREQLQRAQQQARRLSEAGGRELVSQEAMRQQIETLEASLGERQREISDAQAAHNMLEDELEDAHRQLDQALRELEKAQADADEAISIRREAESARSQLQEALVQTQRDAEQARDNDLRDARLVSAPGRTGGAAGGRGWLSGLVGAVLAIAGLAGVSFATGNGDLVIRFLRGLGL